jgi:hypothetical protein
MALRMGTKIDRGYATVAADDGGNYREIAELMTLMGHRMNHSSARNHVLRIMARFVRAFTDAHGIPVDDERVEAIARSPSFQSGICELLQHVELRRRHRARAA